MNAKLLTLKEVSELISLKRNLIVAGHEKVLDKLPAGSWIGGSNPYLFGENGGQYTEDLLYVKDFTPLAEAVCFKTYDQTNIHKIASDGYSNGLIVLILPVFSEVWRKFAVEAPTYENQFQNPLLGWVAGSKYEETLPGIAKTYIEGVKYSDKAVVMNIKLPDNKVGRMEIVNVYNQGAGDEIFFPKDGLDNTTCIVNGEETDLYDYLESINFQWYLPFMANYNGAKINVGVIQQVETRSALFAAPVFKDTPYKIAENVSIDYISEFRKQLTIPVEKVEYSYSCLFNYYNFELDGRPLPDFAGVFTYGEFAYQLLNLTFAYLTIDELG